jgi:hypothetical protein
VYELTCPFGLPSGGIRRYQLAYSLEAAMAETIAKAFVVVGLAVMLFLAYAQKHEGCVRGRSLESFQPCGSIEAHRP